MPSSVSFGAKNFLRKAKETDTDGVLFHISIKVPGDYYYYRLLAHGCRGRKEKKKKER